MASLPILAQSDVVVGQRFNKEAGTHGECSGEPELGRRQTQQLHPSDGNRRDSAILTWQALDGSAGELVVDYVENQRNLASRSSEPKYKDIPARSLQP
jgi:hypothetical protein